LIDQKDGICLEMRGVRRHRLLKGMRGKGNGDGDLYRKGWGGKKR